MRGVSGRRWELLYLEKKPPGKLVERFGKVLAHLLVNRGLDRELELLLEPSLSKLPSLRRVAGLEEAVGRILDHVRKKKRIILYGDYDVDGITGTAILYKTLKLLGARVYPVLPTRLTGYGLNPELMGVFEKYGEVLITVDNGTSAVREIESSGMDVIVVDHHNVPQEIPRRGVVVNPKLSSDTSLRDLSSSALAFFMAALLLKSAGLDEDPRLYLDLVALGLLADAMPLNYVNRILTLKGMALLGSVLRGEVKKPGLKALMEVAGIREEVRSRDISFSLAPMINAPGRVYRPRVALDLLLEEKEERAFRLARRLEQYNEKRRRLTRKITREARKKVREEPFVLVWSEDWHPGVLGIVAGKLSGELGKPVGVFSVSGDRAVGSLRSCEGIDIYEKVSSLSELFLKWGGHSRAMGLTIETGKLPLLREKLNELFSDTGRRELTFRVDFALNPEELSPELLDKLKLLEPYGEGNPYPLFMGKARSVKKVSRYGLEVNGKLFLCWDEELMRALTPGKRFLYSVAGRELYLEDVENGSAQNPRTL
ncbi:MAG: single-stranded-DNA-specific exonuclease RecJ [Aquificae bacterium]|nr:single-stranded-DNA-specific exonuclease RecJ [Aquificota bacterium]